MTTNQITAQPIRVGIGYDVHAFEDGRPLILGGVHIPGHAGLAGHSDADVLLHAVMDSLLGALALGDRRKVRRSGQHGADRSGLAADRRGRL